MIIKSVWSFIVLGITIFLQNVSSGDNKLNISRSFQVDYTSNQFVKDGKPFRYVSGSMHYFRVPRVYWRDRLKKMRACGLNAVSTYVEWSTIEPKQGKYDFNGENDIEHFIKLAAEEDLLVILRVGPYICSERSLGGYPWWLFREKPSMELRTSDQLHSYYVDQWLSVLMPRVQPLLYGNGGPIIMVQVENEYASYWACDKNYTTWLGNIFMKYVKDDAVLFTTDGYYIKQLQCGKIPNILATVDFGPGTNVTNAFAKLRKIQKQGPLVNSEYYTGTLPHWGEKMKYVPTKRIIRTLKEILDVNASVNFYMFVGGTNFGFTSGANNGKTYKPVITSYHNDAPINEAGNPSGKYYAIAHLLSQYEFKPSILAPKPALKGNYGTIRLTPQLSFFKLAENGSQISTYPKSYANFGQGEGLLLYQTKLQGENPSVLHVPRLRDRAIVFVNEVAVGIIDRNKKKKNLTIGGKTGQKLSILTENQGRINYGYLTDFKGILSNISVNGVEQHDWSLFSFPANKWTESMQDYEVGINVSNIKPPAFYTGHLYLNDSSTYLDTFVDMHGWRKGVVYVNGINLGRYWPSRGPQQSLYLPGCYLKNDNHIIVFELELAKPDMSVSFSNHPIFKR